MHDQTAPTNLPSGSLDDVRSKRGTETVTFEWQGKKYTIQAKPNQWGIEKRAVRACSDSSGIDPGKWVEFMLQARVEESSVPLREEADRFPLDPDFVWAAARAMGVLKDFSRLGMRLMADDAQRRTMQDIVREYLTVEHRLKRAGYTVADLDTLPAREVEQLYTVEEADRREEVERQAAILGNIIARRLGM